MHDLNKLLEKCPYTETVNFAMTVKNIMIYANEIGWTEDHQIEIFLLLLCQHVHRLRRFLCLIGVLLCYVARDVYKIFQAA